LSAGRNAVPAFSAYNQWAMPAIRAPLLTSASVRAVALAFAAIAVLLQGCASVRWDVARPASTAWDRPQESRLAQAYAPQLQAHPGQSGFHLLSAGMDALAARAGLAEAANHTLDLQYYMVRQDATSLLLLSRVMHAALRGVRVRLLVDDLFAAGKDFDLAAFAAHPNVQVRVFNPFASRGAFGLRQLLEFLGDAARLNRRMHNKLWIADNAAAIVGGRNLGDEYFDAGDGVNFCDLDLLAVGPVVAGISRSFDEYWNSESAVPIGAFAAEPGGDQFAAFEAGVAERLDRFRQTVYARALREGHVAAAAAEGRLTLQPAAGEAVYDAPSKSAPREDNAFVRRMGPLLNAAEREVLFISPYFIPDAHAVDLFRSLTARGVRVRVLTNSLASTDVPAVHGGYARVRPALLRAGVQLHEMRPQASAARTALHFGSSSGASLHAKAVVVDGRHVLLGSMNMDPRSRLHNTEVGVLLRSEALAGQVASVFAEGTRPVNAFRVESDAVVPGEARLRWVSEEDGRRTVSTREPAAGLWRRAYAALARLLAPESLL
jgi:cardiolipin synthase C